MSESFKFKQFSIHQDRCAMKIGTDGVLLGAWASLDKKPNTILDIGAGTGLIALMMAQRSDAEIIDAIEIEEAAYEQCVENLENSPWGDRLFCYHAGLDEFVDEVDDKYDLIISNPPFYSEDVSSGDKARDRARQNNSLPFDELLEGVRRLLSKNGVFSVIVPHKEERLFITVAEKQGLYPKRITRVKGNYESPVKRSLLEFGFARINLTTNELVIEISRQKYTSEYMRLTKAFYLKM
ncbi:tRNA1(Val) (adenine(37)-N6)-methyltransferase [Maribacter sp. 2304DJ31-5]|uniref:tRNA1(Val) (adenine(37)-N6)-methyltransferase n=1 Tax=Maribacter sp. 2304DJ31-5 TaxID=3386273 RepID=UPI0039BD7176